MRGGFRGSGSKYFTKDLIMIITRTPFRISFAGGGSDFRGYYENSEGAVLSATINKYIYLTLHPYFDNDQYLLKYSKVESVSSVEDIQHPIIREVFKKYGISGVDLNSIADIPARTGLASSSAFTVGMINLCNVFTNRYMSKEEIAREACEIEIDILKEPIGKQDQYACACGGLNFLKFNRDGTVEPEKIYLNSEDYHLLENNLMLFYTGKTRSANEILSVQNTPATMNDEKKIGNLHKMAGLAISLRGELRKGNIDAIGEILHQGWMYKRELVSGITEPWIDQYYDLARKNGADGGKILGAGGGGFFLFYVKPCNQDRLRNALQGLREIPFAFDTRGTDLIYFKM